MVLDNVVGVLLIEVVCLVVDAVVLVVAFAVVFAVVVATGALLLTVTVDAGYLLAQ